MVSKYIIAMVVPVAVVVFLWFTHTPPFEQTSTTTTLAGVVQVGFVLRWWHVLGGLLVAGILYYLNQKAKEYISYPEEQIKEMLRMWLLAFEGMVLDDVWACVYDPEAKHELTRIVFRVKSPEKYAHSYCYITFHRGRFEGLQKYLNYVRCEELLDRRLRYMPKISSLKKASWLGEEKK